MHAICHAVPQPLGRCAHRPPLGGPRFAGGKRRIPALVSSLPRLTSQATHALPAWTPPCMHAAHTLVCSMARNSQQWSMPRLVHTTCCQLMGTQHGLPPPTNPLAPQPSPVCRPPWQLRRPQRAAAPDAGDGGCRRDPAAPAAVAGRRHHRAWPGRVDGEVRPRHKDAAVPGSWAAWRDAARAASFVWCLCACMHACARVCVGVGVCVQVWVRVRLCVWLEGGGGARSGGPVGRGLTWQECRIGLRSAGTPSRTRAHARVRTHARGCAGTHAATRACWHAHRQRREAEA